MLDGSSVEEYTFSKERVVVELKGLLFTMIPCCFTMAWFERATVERRALPEL